MRVISRYDKHKGDKHERWCQNKSKKADIQQHQLTYPRIRPMRVAAQRGREVMCIMEYQEAEWLDSDECSLEGLEIQAEETAVSGTRYYFLKIAQQSGSERLIP